MNESITPIFLFSLPRSGSTLAQRVLSTHESIATVSEPWILLPLLYPLKGGGVYTEYNHGSLLVAFEDFCETLPNKRDDYIAEVGKMALSLYKKSGGNAPYFLDKTPRYHTISKYIVKAFPDGKFIFLWRHPLANAASILETFSKGRWNLYRYKIDLYRGLSCLIKTYLNNPDACAVRFEDLLAGNKQESWERIFAYLGIEFDPSMLERFSSSALRGRWGDTKGIKQYAEISTEPLEKWKRTMGNPIRKIWCRRYLKWIGRERLAAMGYDYDELLVELKEIPINLRYFLDDLVLIPFGLIYCWFEPYVMLQKFKYIFAWRYVNVHR